MAQINLDTLPRTRKEAQALGSKHHFTGKPCPKGHVDKRFTGGGNCFACLYASTSAQSKARLEKQRQEVLSMRLDCAQCGATFTPEFGKGKKSKAAKYCGDACRAEADKAVKLQWLKANPETRKAVANAYAQRITAEKGEQWRKAVERSARYHKERRAVDPEFRLIGNLRTRYRQALLHYGAWKTTSVTKLAGCSLEELRAHIEAQFQPGMTWDNWTKDGWHLDHIKPIASFDRPDHPDCWHYTNLQPLWAEENLKKGARLAA
jgi:5-methylcytosine-specific restriction endonuclease McrA